MAADSRTQLLTGHTETPDTVVQTGVWNLVIDASAGDLTVDVNGETSDSINWDDNAGEVKTALVGSGEVDTGDLTVTGTGASDDPFVVTIPDDGNGTEYTIDNLDASGLTGDATLTVVEYSRVLARHETEVVLDPEGEDAVQTPIEQQFGVVGNADEDSPATVLSL